MDDFKVPILPPAQVVKSVPVPPVAEPTPLTQKPKTTSGCPYRVPKWSRPPAPEESYRFEVLKSGQIIDEVKALQQQAIWTFGRLPDNDVAMAHPTISRYHAVLQYKPKATCSTAADEEEGSDHGTKADQPEGWYIYDLGSTHGTFLNKQRVPPRVYIRIRVGHMLKLGSSTRVYILQGPSDDEEPESELTITELREQREQQVAAAAAEKERKAQEAEQRERNEGASWGMGEDADEETDLAHNPYASTNNEELFFDDPKRTLRGFFEREGLNLEYKCDELAQGSFVCRVELPIDDSNGRPIVVEVTHKGRKKDCVVQCALEACRTLDRHGVLRQANQESQKRKQPKTGDSDDEDEFWDRTGDVARKKQRKANTSASVTLTYEDLLKQEAELEAELQRVGQEIADYQQNEKRLKELAVKQQSASDDLDNFMDTLSENVSQVDKTEIKKLRLEEQRIKTEQQKLQRLIRIAKPTSISFAMPSSSTAIESKAKDSNTAKKQLPMIGKRNQFSKFKVVKELPSARTKVQANVFGSDDEEEEDYEEEVDDQKLSQKPTEQTVAKPSTSLAAAEIKTTAESEMDTKNSPTASADVVSTSNVAETPLAATAELPVAAVEEAAKVDADTVGARTEEMSAEEAAHKKRRQRARQRSNKQRQDVDMDLNELTEHEDSDKYAKWVPPTNQSGDGFTHLNEKFGY